MICCAKPRATRFCPECGTELYPAGVLSDLLRHVERVASQHAKNADLYDKADLDASDPDYKERLLRRNARYRRLSATWRAYAEALRALLAAPASQKR